MGRRFLPVLLVVLTSMAAMAAATNWVVVPNVEKDSHVQSLGKYVVDTQNNPYLKFIKVVYAEVLNRGTEHYTYKLVICLVEGTRTAYYSSEILQDLGAPNQPPVLNIASFNPTSYSPKPNPNWITIPNDGRAWNLCSFAVKRYNSQNHASLRLSEVVFGQMLDRGTEHFTYHFTIRVSDRYYVEKTYKIEVFQELSAPGQPLVLNLGYFQAL
ncbi:uncharacterized protein LOC126410124 isoform X1 [Nymphaea colorata]|uniref:uncharacterized protein LOC126410124 isoform X1 n=1 Tax=Nymphaea colorata TaxID=210225 RepID=UPI00214F57D6|nr:uncharacterized protein LOC126410124 isoform X1 [Nymphaea colorata]